MRFVDAILACCLCLCAAAAAVAPPVVMTPWQVQLFDRQNAAAKRLSDAAEPAVMDHLAHSPDFRSSLSSCCPELSSVPASELLALYKRLFEWSEMVHNFEVAPGGHHGDVDVVIVTPDPAL